MLLYLSILAMLREIAVINFCRYYLLIFLSIFLFLIGEFPNPNQINLTFCIIYLFYYSTN